MKYCISDLINGNMNNMLIPRSNILFSDTGWTGKDQKRDAAGDCIAGWAGKEKEVGRHT